MNEASFIAALRLLADRPSARGLADDTAVLEIGGEALVLTHDMLVEGVHVLSGQDPADIAWKIVAVNLSDLAAKGAAPIGVLLGHMLGEDDERFIEGLREVLSAYDVALLGGDTVRSDAVPRAWGLTAVGRATHRPVPSRGGAQPGDLICLTGSVGAAMMGLEALRNGRGGDSIAYRRPRPLLTEGQLLAPHVTAMMDVSDGVLLDSRRIAEASGVTLDIDTAAVPIAAPEPRRADALRWGEDYQLLCAVSPGAEPPLPLHTIGKVLHRGDHPLLIDGKPPRPEDRLGYTH